ncbi:alpha/beta hydrolase [Bacillus sp. Marseille-P3661]|uniref:alpha/beta hydrolase n=1 Tax=Bacillus sp. Marseille-P3661 TaxID=1936234 RepID=UPI000C8347B1|nr:carboxylesterase [Bacillus sp. Marseille-P3661]
MKLMPPKPFTFETDGDRAVLLLHGFTGNSADVRMLGRFLESKGYTCHAPVYKGHGVSLEELVEYGPDDWWEDVRNGYQFLKDKGYEKIAVCGISLGGVFSLKLGYTEPIKAIIPMCAPMYMNKEEIMLQGVLSYAKEYKRREGKSDEQIAAEMEELQQAPMKTIHALQNLIVDVRKQIDLIYAPTFVVQGRLDDMINTDSANVIYEEVQTDQKKIKWYEESGHAITFDKERDQLHEDIYEFLHNLNW